MVCWGQEVGTHWPELASCLVPPSPRGSCALPSPQGWAVSIGKKQRAQAEAPGEWVWRKGPCLSPSSSSCWMALLGTRFYYGTDADTVTVSPTVVAPREIQGTPVCSGPQLRCWNKICPFDSRGEEQAGRRRKPFLGSS